MEEEKIIRDGQLESPGPIILDFQNGRNFEEMVQEESSISIKSM